MTGVKFLEQNLGSRIHDGQITISAVKFFELINQAKEIDKENDFEYDLDIEDGQDY